MKLHSNEGLIWYPLFYDLDTNLGINNSGQLLFDIDSEIQAGIFNTSNSKLWVKLQRVFAKEIRDHYSLMRLDRFTEENIMKYLEGEQISKIPDSFYNNDIQRKYLGDTQYLYVCHGNDLQRTRRWIRERLLYVDSMLGYLGTTSDFITLRANKLGYVYIDLEMYIPMYARIKFRSEANDAGTIVKKIGRGEKVRFEYNLPTQTENKSAYAE